MNIKKNIRLFRKPKFLKKNKEVARNDLHKSKKMIGVHLNSELDKAGREHRAIDIFVKWMIFSKLYDNRF